MKYILFLFMLVVSNLLVAQPIIKYESEHPFLSLTPYAEIIEDKDENISKEQALKGNLTFEKLGVQIQPNLNFTHSTYWVKVEFMPEFGEGMELLLETGRPLTNIAEYYHFIDDSLVSSQISGDGIPFESRSIQQRKILFEVPYKDGLKNTILLKLKSDGEVLAIPLKLWTKHQFYKTELHDNLIFGFYYGMLSIVALIFFFFYVALKDKSFKYYVLYILSLILFQFSLDGFSYQFLFPNSLWLANHIVLVSAAITVIFVLRYAQFFLKIPACAPVADRIYRVLIIASIISIVLSLLGGQFYILSYPIVNAVSLISTLFIFYTILLNIYRKEEISPYFFLAFLFLITGAVLFILGNFHVVESNFFTENGIKLGSAFEVAFLSVTMAKKFQQIQMEKEFAQQENLVKLEEMNKLKDEVNTRLDHEVKERTKEIEHQKEELQEKNREVLSSIRYAKRLQDAILPSKEYMLQHLPGSFVLYKPKDIISGDFYWMAPLRRSTGDKEALVVFAVADCTGHGVPGAIMSFIGNSYLKQSTTEDSVNTPSQALDFLNKGIASTFQQFSAETELKDGMDISLCAIDFESKKMEHAAAMNPIYLVRKGEVIEFKADKQPIGSYNKDTKPFTNNVTQLEKGDMVYLFSDGYADQFGGDKGKKMGYKKLREILQSIAHEDGITQKLLLEEYFTQWQGSEEQVDDVCVMGVRI